MRGFYEFTRFGEKFLLSKEVKIEYIIHKIVKDIKNGESVPGFYIRYRFGNDTQTSSLEATCTLEELEKIIIPEHLR